MTLSKCQSENFNQSARVDPACCCMAIFLRMCRTFFRTENFRAGKFSRSEFSKPVFFGCKDFKVRFFSDVKFFCPEIFARENFKARNFSGNKILTGKNSVSAKESTSETYRSQVTFFMIKPENFRAEIFLCRIFLGVKNLGSVFFGRKNFKVRFFSDVKFFCPEIFGTKNCAAGKMGGLIECRLPFLSERLVQST